jgi:hypothetical protein
MRCSPASHALSTNHLLWGGNGGLFDMVLAPGFEHQGLNEAWAHMTSIKGFQIRPRHIMDSASAHFPVRGNRTWTWFVVHTKKFFLSITWSTLFD